MAEAGVLKGFPDGTFHPDEPVTEEQFMAMLQRVIPSYTGHPLSEVEQKFITKARGRWSEALYKKLAAAGIYGNGQPDGNLTRLQAARLLLMASASQSEGEKYRYTTARFFSDVPVTKDVMRIYPVYKMSLMSGYPDGTFRPDEQVSRAQAAVLAKRLGQQIEQLFPDNVEETTRQALLTNLRNFFGKVNQQPVHSYAQLSQFVDEQDLNVTPAFLDEHFAYLKNESVHTQTFPRFDELAYITRISDTKYRVTMQYYGGELLGSVDHSFYLLSKDGKTFLLIGKNE